jgi:hypothetical protein
MEIDPSKLRDLASWYRAFAERAGNPAIWAARLRTAEDLEVQADLFERRAIRNLDRVREGAPVSAESAIGGMHSIPRNFR